MSPDIQRELLGLLSALCDGALAEPQTARLEELLADDAECRRQYLEYMDLHARLLVHPRLGQTQMLPSEQPVGPTANESSIVPLAGASAEASLSTLTAARRRHIQFVRYGIVAAATLGISLLLQLFWWHPQRPEDGKKQSAGAKYAEPHASGYVATLVQSADCTWEKGRHRLCSGARLATGKFRLQKGVARIRLDTGSEMLVEGPSDLNLDSDTAATLELGKIVFRTDETASPFELRTPWATLLDFGTEYAVSVGPEGEEIQVFEGNVQRVPRGSAGTFEPEKLEKGQARRFGRSPSAKSQPAEFDPSRWVRQLPAAKQQLAESTAGLLAYEGFEYESPEQFHTGNANGGLGWNGPWIMSFAQPLEWGEKKRLPLNVEEGLSRPGAEMSSVGGKFDHAGFGVYHRRLATPVRLDADGVYYISFLFRRFGPPAHPQNVISVMLRPHEKPHQWPDISKRLTIGVGGSNQLFTHLGKMNARACLPMTGNTYLLTAKIVASSSTSEQIFVRVYAPKEPVSIEEPDSWTVVSPPFQSDLVFDSLGIHVNSKNRQMIDEIRVGLTWSSVTAPWIVEPPVVKNGG